MCGIAGITILRSGEVRQHTLRQMIKKLHHRGPEGSGVYISRNHRIGLAHCRLALLDLSARGSQPMTKDDLVVTFNGEIYNYIELRRELRRKGYAFSTESDTEVLLCAFACWREAAFTRLRGDFAFILYDVKRDETYAVRDRLGVKPLVYFADSDLFIAASEAKALLVHPRVPIRPNLERIQSDLIFNFWSEKRDTYFSGIMNVPPGHYIRIAQERLAVLKYWDLPAIKQPTHSKHADLIRDYVKQLSAIVEEAIKIRLRTDCEIGSLLSGGIDSSLLTQIASEHLPYKLRCFTLKRAGHMDSDSTMASAFTRINRHLIHHPVPIEDEHLSSAAIDSLVYHVEETLLDRVYAYIFRNYATIRSCGLKVVLNGQGSDEVTLGYYRYYPFLQKGPSFFKFHHFAAYWYEQYFMNAVSSSRDSRALIERNLTGNLESFNSGEALDVIARFAVRTHLQSLLLQEDRLSMAHSIECRVPYTDHMFVEYNLKIPSTYKIYDKREKYLMRKMAAKMLPAPIINRRKLGFPSLPDHSKETVGRLTRSRSFRKSQILNTLFTRDWTKHLSTLSLEQRWKLVTLQRLESVFFC